MKRQFLLFTVLFFSALPSFANHITGGEIYYTYKGMEGVNHVYAVTIKLFKDASIGVALDDPLNVAVYANGSNLLVLDSLISQASLTTITATPGPCIVNPPLVSYQVGLYIFDLKVPASFKGYTITWARCCRVTGITNLLAPSSGSGATYTSEIPGNLSVPTGPINSSAKFLGIDTVIICAGYPFQYNFGAIDPDSGDILTYEFCNGYGNTGGTLPRPPDAPPYPPLSYSPSYSGTSPMGSGVSIDPNTGMITGAAPAAGIYVVTVCVHEWRDGVIIATQRKDLQIKVADCDLATVTLEPNGYINCVDFTLSFKNLSPSSLINSYFWDFGNKITLADTSHLATPSYTYPDTGVYTLKVVANRNAPCSDSTTAKVRVFPGFFPAFDHTGICMNTPVQFNDLTTAAYGVVDFWRYNFGVASLSNDTSRSQNPQYIYTAKGNYRAELIVGTSKGCRDTIDQPITIIDKPAITMAFRDTLICNDTIQLNVTGTGIISWTPNYNIVNAGTESPSVFPQTTTLYSVELNDNGCRNTDSINVRVVNSVSLTVPKDTSICANDAVQLLASSNGFHHNWTPSQSLNDPTLLHPLAIPLSTTTYHISSSIGNCVATEDITIILVPHTLVDAGNDIDICYNTAAQLNAQTNGTSFTWSNSRSLNELNVLNPIATPLTTTSYILTAISNSSGCPKPSYDTVTVTVLPKVNAFAGNDTVMIVSMPLQLQASGGVLYEWSPAAGLNNSNIGDPVAALDGNPQDVSYLVKVTDQSGCVDTASIRIKVFKTGPEIFVPTGFTPDNNGRNDVFKPIYVGMKKIEYFRVYNRWGKLIYSNDKNDGQGWNGTINGTRQTTGMFIWVVKATDVLDKIHLKKGTVMLIR